MRIYVDNNAAFTTHAASLNTQLTVSSGNHKITILAWDSSGAVFKGVENITVH